MDNPSLTFRNDPEKGFNSQTAKVKHGSNLLFPRTCAISLALSIGLFGQISSHAAKILYIVSSATSPAANDQEVMARLVGQGHTVTLADDDTVSAADTTGMNLVLISSSVNSGAAGVNPLSSNTLRLGRIPVVCYEPGLYDELLLQTATTFGNAGGHTSLAISVANQTHPLAAAKSGTVNIVNPGSTATVSSSALPLTLGRDAIIIATNATPAVDEGRIAIWAYEKLSRLADNASVVLGRRVAFFYNASTAAGVYNTNATDLFDAAINWALQPPPNLPILAFLISPPTQNAPPNASVVVELEDGSTTQVNPLSISVSLNGTVAAAPVVTKSDTITTVSFSPPTLLPAGSVNTVIITFNDTVGAAYSNSWSYTVENYPTLPPEYAVSGVDTTKRGFTVRSHQIPIPRSPGDPNTIANAERQLAGGFIDPSTLQPYTNMIVPGITGPPPDPDGTYPLDVINWNEFGFFATCNSASGTDIGNFRGTNSFPTDVPDTDIPGLYGCADAANPALPGYNDNIAVEVRAYLDLAAGFYTFGVNSDDGFKLSAARAIGGDVIGLTLGSFDTGRGAADTLLDVYVPADGIYPVRLIWWEGGGAANCEFFYIDRITGQKVLVNDQASVHVGGQPAVQNPIKAYPASATVSATRPYVSRVSPEPNQLFVFADADVTAWITDGTFAVDPAAVSLSVNGTATGAATKSGKVTTITRPGSLSNLLPAGTNNASLVYSYTDQGNTVSVTNNWIFTVVPYTVIPVANAAAPGSVTLADLGFKALIDQIDRSGDTNQGNGGRLFTGDQNRMPRPEIQLAGGTINSTNGARYPNLAAGAVSEYVIPGVLNFNVAVNSGVASAADSGLFQTAQGYRDQLMPGLPGIGTSNAGVDNYAAEFRTYLDLKAGAYVMAVNSDDGFVAISAPDPHDTLGTLLGFANFGRGNSSPLPAPPATLPVPTPGTGNGNSTFQVVAPQDGLYPFRILYWQGGGGVNIEFLSVDKGSGLQTLINATNTVATATSALGIKAYRTYAGPARPWVKFSVSPSPWDYRSMQSGPGPILTYGRTRNSTTSSDIYNWQDNYQPWADVRIGGVVANGVGDSSLGLLLDAVPVAATLTTNATDVTVSYKPAPPLVSGSTHTASLVYGGTTNSWTFTVQTYTNLNAADAQPLNAGDAGAAGFRVKIVQAASGTGLATTVASAESQLAGSVPNVAVPGPGPNGTYIFPGIINWNNNLNSTNLGGLPINAGGTPIGNFQTNTYGTGWPFPSYRDDPLPGCPGTNLVNCNWSAAEIFAYLKFATAGYYRFGVNGDDGWAVRVGTPGQTNGTVLFTIDRGAGAADIPFSFTVPQAGLFPIRLVWYNGTGGANLEFFSYDDNGNKIPINDPNNAASIKAYYSIGVAAQIQFTSMTVSGGQVHLSVTVPSGTATLEQASALTGNASDWSTVQSGLTGTTTIDLPAVQSGNKFYRLKQ